MPLTLSQLVQRRWSERKLPSFDGVLFADARIVLFSGATLTGQDYKTRSVGSPLADSTLESFLKYREDAWSTCTDLDRCVSLDGRLRLVCGEGAMGNEGFVSLVDECSGDLKWVASFGFSNPFDEVCFRDGFAHVINTHEQVWRFPLDAPERVKVSDWIGP